MTEVDQVADSRMKELRKKWTSRVRLTQQGKEYEDVQLPEFDFVFDDLNPSEFNIVTMVEAAFDDLDQLKRFLEIILQGGVEQDNKYSALKKLLTDY